jgi:deoxyribonuclease-1
MAKKNSKSQTQPERKPLNINLTKQLIVLRENLRKMYEDKQVYFHEKQNKTEITQYYQTIINQSCRGTELFYKYNHLIEKTHKNQNPYFISKDLYLYTWVDLYPDGTVKCIYSGETKDPRSLILQEYELIGHRAALGKEFEKAEQKDYELLKQLKTYERKLKLNTEHIVPQSWFGALEPMKGDLHHLFVCNPECNIVRSNFTYDELCSLSPESNPHHSCGSTLNERFEPRFGKGAIARAMLYFFLRYPRSIKKAYRNNISIPLLINWHLQNQVTLYEKHRNQAIYRIQGNRNPFIDFPDLLNYIEFPIYFF